MRRLYKRRRQQTRKALAVDMIRKLLQLLGARPSLVSIHYHHRIPNFFFASLIPVVGCGILLIALGVFMAVNKDFRLATKDLIFGKPSPIGEEKHVTQVPKPVPVPRPAKPPEKAETRKEAPIKEEHGYLPPAQPPQDGIWHVRYGDQYQNGKDAVALLRATHVELSLNAVTLLERIPTIEPEQSISIEIITVEELGFTSPATLQEIMLAAKRQKRREVPVKAVPGVILNLIGEKRYFFGTQIAPKGSEWRAVLVMSKSTDDTAPKGLSIIGRYGSFEHEPDFYLEARFVFAR